MDQMYCFLTFQGPLEKRVYVLPPKIRVARCKRWFQENRMLSSLDCWVLLAAKPRAEVRDIWVGRVF
jgi:hypothetical protein